MINLKRFKKGKDLDIINSFQNFCQYNNLNYESFSSDIEELHNYKKLVNKQNQSYDTTELNKNITYNLTYIEILSKINDSIKIGNENGKWNIEFVWTNITTGNVDSYSDYYYEICSVKYNIGINFCLLGFIYLNSKDENELKFSKQSFEKAAFVFDEIKNLSSNIQNNNVTDFSNDYLNICINFSLGMAQYYIYLYAVNKKLKEKSLSKYIAGGYEFLLNALSINFEKGDKTFIFCLEHYFHCLAIHYHVISNLPIVIKKKKGMGLIYGYEAYAYELIKEINNDKINKIKDEFDINLISILKNQITDFLHENYNNINVVYKEKVVDKNSLPKLEYSQLSKLVNYMDSPNLRETNLNDKKVNLNQMANMTLNKIPNDLLEIVSEYKNKMENILKEKFEKYENSDKILQFLSKKDLPYILEPFLDYNPAATPTGEIGPDPRIIDVIRYIKGKGGIHYLKKYINQLDYNYNTITNILKKFENMIYNFIQEDNNYKNLYGNKWEIQSPFHYQIELNNLKNIIISQRKIDEKIKNDILQREKHYAVFDQSEENIILKIPNPIQLTTQLDSAKNLRNGLKILNDDEILINKSFNLIFENITKQIPIEDLKKVKNNEITIENIIQNEIKKMYKSFKIIEEYSNKIRKDMKNIETLFDEFEKQSSQIKNESYNKAISYFTKIKSLFIESEDLIGQRINFYNDFKNRGLRNFQESFDGYTFMRDILMREMKDN